MQLRGGYPHNKHKLLRIMLNVFLYLQCIYIHIGDDFAHIAHISYAIYQSSKCTSSSSLVFPNTINLAGNKTFLKGNELSL